MILLAALALTATASSTFTPERAIANGYTAYLRGDLETAARWYVAAQPRTTEPCLVAFSLATIKHGLGVQRQDEALLVEAAALYRCCLEPADPYRAEALYGLGCCLLSRAEKSHKELREAIACLASALSTGELSTELADAARYNLARARLALRQAPAVDGGAPEPESPSSDGGQKQQRPALDDGRPENLRPGQTHDHASGDPVRINDPSTEGTEKTDAAPPPGQGARVPIPDDPHAAPLSPADARAHLEDAAARIRAERQRRLRNRSARPTPPGIKDW